MLKAKYTKQQIILELKTYTEQPHPHTSSLKSLLVSFLMGSRYCTWPAEKPTMRATLSAVAEY